MSKTIPKHIRELAAWAEPQGWSWSHNGKHLRWTHSEVSRPVFTPHTPTVRESHKPRQKLAAAYRAATGKEMTRD